MIRNITGMHINVIVKEDVFELPEQIKERVEDFWEEAKLENPNLWNGELMCVSEYQVKDNEITVICKKSNYAHYLYDERIGLPKQYACSSLVAGCLLETSDGYYVVGELAEDTSFPYCLQISGGSADNHDIKDGKIDVYNTILRECEEELNIKLQDKTQVQHFEMKYISLPSDTVHTYILFAKGILNMTREEMQQYYAEYLTHLKENNLKIEFSKIHFLQKGETTEQLNKFSNPRREYLESLLAVDSREGGK